ncbi:TMEM175 family protein [Allorhizobium taibaishanense]|uniref:Putative membrane protein n=1 Tax=Allorhizobium taibaishanense TaxID=887144 RepID=A0A1Q9A764_9HYPH|nr:TMEM175 family protein [Allorhizobium taibaishanense]MBB4008430.1 putative membrane protein [Allorhizobium taibaishanense]OLP50399.1 hypothetical protein BJF91_13955 [Allorhizobium taibaishanense]
MRLDPQAFFYRRVEALGDIVFGVAMTMLVYDVPLHDRLSAAPTLSEIWNVDGQTLTALGLSFAVGMMFWLSHHRRLALARRNGGFEFVVTAAFLLSIACLPLTTSLYGIKGAAGDVLTVYSSHLAIIALLNVFLWLMAWYSKADMTEPVAANLLIPPIISFAILAAAAVTSLWSSDLPQILMYAAFLSPLSEHLARRVHRTDKKEG